MRNYLIAGMLVLASLGVNGQEKNTDIKEGDTLEIVKPSNSDFKHINFPKKNIIIKRGGIASNKLVNGKQVIVTKVTTENDGSTKISIKKADGSRFYKAIPTVTVDYESALNSGEIKVLK